MCTAVPLLPDPIIVLLSRILLVFCNHSNTSLHEEPSVCVDQRLLTFLFLFPSRPRLLFAGAFPLHYPLHKSPHFPLYAIFCSSDYPLSRRCPLSNTQYWLCIFSLTFSCAICPCMFCPPRMSHTSSFDMCLSLLLLLRLYWVSESDCVWAVSPAQTEMPQNTKPSDWECFLMKHIQSKARNLKCRFCVSNHCHDIV